MSWFKKISQAKPMPLPFDRPPDNELFYHGYNRRPDGLDKIDQMMTDETAKRHKEHWEPKYLGSGMSGLAVDLDNGLVGKYTNDIEEAEFARHIAQNPVPCVIKVYDVEDAQQQRTDPITSTRQHPLWMIISEKAKVLSDEEKEIALKYNDWQISPDANDFPSLQAHVMQNRQFALEDHPDRADFINKLFGLAECFKQHDIIAEDLIGDNIGYDKNGNLVLIDLGSTSTS